MVGRGRTGAAIYRARDRRSVKTEIHHEATSDETTPCRRLNAAAGIVSGEFISRLPRRCPSRRLISNPPAAASPPVSP